MGSEWKIQNENICIQLKSNQRPLTGVMLYDTCLVTWQLTACRIRYFPWNKRWSIEFWYESIFLFVNICVLSISVWTILEINLSYFKLYCRVSNWLWLDVYWIWLLYKCIRYMLYISIYRTWTRETIIHLIHVLSCMLILIICKGSIRVETTAHQLHDDNCQCVPIVLGA